MLWLGLLLFALVPLSEVTGQENNIEVYFVVDQVAQQRYRNEFGMSQNDLREEIDYIITEMNKLYEDLGLGLTIYKRKLEFLTSDFTTNVIDQQKLEDFRNWLLTNKKQATLGYDIAMLWTGHDLVKKEHGRITHVVAGLAYLSRVCNKEYGVGISELHGTFADMLVVAHEIGHLLGAKHDEDSIPWVMSPSAGVDTNFMFSHYSEVQIRDNLAKTSCQRTTSHMSTVPNQGLPSRLNNPTKVCKREMGASGRMCGHNKVNAGGDAVCSKLTCSNDDWGALCSNVNAYNGMICGRQKTCKQGWCKYDPKSNTGNVKDGCPYGDMSMKSFLAQSPCSDLKGYGSAPLCTYEKFGTHCCESCNQA